MKIKINKYTISIEKEVKQPVKTFFSEKDSILPIELNPNNNEFFLETLLKTKSATIITFYKNGTKKSKIWNAKSMKANSNVLGNLRSRPEFRKGNWQKANIEKVVVEVKNNGSLKSISKKSLEINPIEINPNKENQAIKPNKLKIGTYVQTTFNDVLLKIDVAELKNLQNARYCKSTFDIQYPLLKKVLVTDASKIERYWKKPVEIIGEKYWLCSEWYENKVNNDRPYYEKWLNKQKVK